jgi:hypothetical protein
MIERQTNKHGSQTVYIVQYRYRIKNQQKSRPQHSFTEHTVTEQSVYKDELSDYIASLQVVPPFQTPYFGR